MVRFSELLEHSAKEGKIPLKFVKILRGFYQSYGEAVEKNGQPREQFEGVLATFLSAALSAFEHPHSFESYHERVRAPVDYYQLGLDLLRPLVVFEQSKILGLENLNQIERQLKQGDNVILLANHQTEPDPQAISLLLEKTHPKLAEELILVAGQRVLTDPLAIPFSLGRNLLCIYSKKYINTPPEEKEEKLKRNQRTLKKMGELLQEGGKCIYVAPSGGRDRRNAQGIVEVAPLDPASIELFGLIAKNAETPTHFYPLALATYDLLPPPNGIEKDLGEKRETRCTPIHLAFGKEVDMLHFPGSTGLSKKELRQARADYIWNEINRDYQTLVGSQHA